MHFNFSYDKFHFENGGTIRKSGGRRRRGGRKRREDEEEEEEEGKKASSLPVGYVARGITATRMKWSNI